MNLMGVNVVCDVDKGSKSEVWEGEVSEGRECEKEGQVNR